MNTPNKLAKGIKPHTSHFACEERLKEYGGKTVGCCCTGHSCIENEQTTIAKGWDWSKYFDTDRELYFNIKELVAQTRATTLDSVLEIIEKTGETMTQMSPTGFDDEKTQLHNSGRAYGYTEAIDELRQAINSLKEV